MCDVVRLDASSIDCIECLMGIQLYLHRLGL